MFTNVGQCITVLTKSDLLFLVCNMDNGHQRTHVHIFLYILGKNSVSQMNKIVPNTTITVHVEVTQIIILLIVLVLLLLLLFLSLLLVEIILPLAAVASVLQNLHLMLIVVVFTFVAVATSRYNWSPGGTDVDDTAGC